VLSLLLSTIVFAAGGENGLPVKAPASVGMSPARLEKIDHVVERGIAAGGFPGASVVVGRRGAAVWQKGFGRLSWSTSAAPVTAERTIYDLASLTKVVGTTTAIMILFDEGKIRLDDHVKRFLPAFSGGNKDQVTVRMLLEHRSGLPAGRDLWRRTRTAAEARAMVISTPLSFRPNQYVEYSDLGADLLGFIVEEIAGQRLDRFLHERVFSRLGMTETFFNPSVGLRDRIAPTELNPPRGYPLRGEVHDENAFALGGVAGHAGLFSTAADLSVFAQMMLNGGDLNGVRIVADSTVALFTRRSAGTRGLGWDTCGGTGSCGEYLGETAFGHTGYTGTSLWIDREREMFVILLTNRVHDARAKRPATVIADVRADLSDAAALAVMDAPAGPVAMPAVFRADKAVDWNRPVPRRRVAARKPPVKKPAVVAKKPATTTKPTATVTQAGRPATSSPAARSATPPAAATKKAGTPPAAATTKKAATPPPAATTKKPGGG
jgi:CubicO group peptidase (beta-lactamase class C family)